MAGFDGTGPEGFGPLTGRGMGPCGDGTPRGGRYYGRGFGGRGRGFNRGFGQGFGRGFGFSRGFPQDYAAPVADEQAYLQERINFLEEELQRLKNIEFEEE